MAEGKIVFSAVDQTSSVLNQIKSGIGSIAGPVGNLAGLFSGLATVAGLGTAVAGIGEFGKACVDEFTKSEQATLKFRAALDGNQKSIANLSGFIDDFSRTTLASDEQIKDIVGSLAALGDSDSQIKKVMEAAKNLSNITGTDLNTSWKQVQQTLEGSTGKLRQYEVTSWI